MNLLERIKTGNDWVVCPLCDRRLIAAHNLAVCREVEATHFCGPFILKVSMREASLKEAGE